MNYTAFPNTEDDFMKLFYDNVKNEVKNKAAQTDPFASESKNSAALPGQKSTFEEFFEALEQNRQNAYDLQEKAQAQYANAVQASLQLGQSNTQLLSELI